MRETFVSREEYPTYYSNLEGLRSRIAGDLPVKSGMRILDLATGYGYFAIEIARLRDDIRIVGIDISEADIGKSGENAELEGFTGRIEVIGMDAVSMEFSDSSFDVVANFMGLEDIHMTRGRDGVKKTFTEVSRVLKPGGLFCFTAMPPEEAETQAQKIEAEIFSYLCGATWLSSEDYLKILTDNEFSFVSRKTYYTGKKLTVEQAKEEIRFACDNVPDIYSIKTHTFEDVWKRFGSRIEKNGVGHYSRVVLFIARKC